MVAFLEGVARSLHAFVRGLGGPGLFLLALADSSFISVPEGNDVLIVVLSAGQPWQSMLYYVAMTVTGSVTGCSILYWVGRRGGSYIEKRVSRDKLERVRSSYQRWGVWAVVIPSILPPPTPFKIFVLSAGVFRLPFPRFFLAVSLGRSVRYLKWGVLAILFGEAVGHFIRDNLPVVGVVLAIILVGGVVVVVILRLRDRPVTSSLVL
jgi:membrane protein YqaA with SNARE-associated domain